LFYFAYVAGQSSLVWIPAAVWLGYQGDMEWAVFTLAWGIFINVADNFVKPYLTSHGSGLPIPFIFIGNFVGSTFGLFVLLC